MQSGYNVILLSYKSWSAENKASWLTKQCRCGEPCCVRKTKACKNANGEWEFTEPEFETTSGGELPEACENIPSSCPVGTIGSTTCLQTCEELMD